MGKSVRAFSGAGLVVALFIVLFRAWVGARPYTFYSISFASERQLPEWVTPMVTLMSGPLIGALCGVAISLSGWHLIRDDTEAPGHRLYLAGRAVLAALLGIAIGMSPTLVLLYVGFAHNAEPASSVVYAIYLVSAVLSYVAALFAVWWTLRASADSRRGSTVRWLALTLPFGAIAATAAGVGMGASLDYSYSTETFVCVIAAVVVVLAATVTATRAIG